MIFKGAYLHVSLPHWHDENLNGLHFETYVMAGQISSGYAPVYLHCEKDFPNGQKFFELFKEHASGLVKEMGYTMGTGCSACETQVKLGETVEETIENLANEIDRMHALEPIIERIVADCKAQD